MDIYEPVEATVEGLTVMIDNYDSFVLNIVQVRACASAMSARRGLAFARARSQRLCAALRRSTRPQYLCELGARVKLVRNDAATIDELVAMAPARIVLSPGPGHPRDAGLTNDVFRVFTGRVPILGVCLGHQAMFEHFGGTVGLAGEVVHGKACAMHHDGGGLFAGLPSPFLAVRYHSLAGAWATLPECLEVTAESRSADGRRVIQGVRHRTACLEGVQFHPESILTQHGHAMLRAFLRMRADDPATWGRDAPAEGTGSAFRADAAAYAATERERARGAGGDRSHVPA
jgi:anthranilate synthase/aminodeoxychorismate synthase-like glutamine amidotransferase